MISRLIMACLPGKNKCGSLNSPDISNILFRPSAQEGKDPEGFEVVDTPVRGAVLKSHLFRNAGADEGNVVVFFHGNGETAEDWFRFARQISEAFRANLLIVDYRGYGLSTGIPTYGNMLSDAEDLFKDVRSRFNGFVHVFGRSIGSAPAIHLAYKFGTLVASLVIDSGFAHLPDLIKRLGRDKVQSPQLPKGFLDNADKLERVSAPTLFLHGVEDRLIPIEAARENFAASESSAKELVELPDAGHNDTVLSTGYFGKIGAFMKPQIENLENRLKEFPEKYPYGQCPRYGGPLDEFGQCIECLYPPPPPIRFLGFDEDATHLLAAFDLEVISPERWAGKFIYNLPCKFEMGRYSEKWLPSEGVPFCALNCEGILVWELLQPPLHSPDADSRQERPHG